MSVNVRWMQLKSRRHKSGLFHAIVAWVFIAMIAYTLLSAAWGHGDGWPRLLSGWSIGATHDPLDRIKVTLTALGGVGAVGYLVIKYRERAALERGEADEKLVRAVQQLGDPSPQVRIAGVYALADVADTYEGPYHQRVVDILCGYLRTDRLLKDANGDTRYATNEDGTPNNDRPLSTDGAVESTILFVLANHLRLSQKHNITEQNSEGPWSHCALDLHDAYITETMTFERICISEFNATGAHFSKNIAFLDCTFAKVAIFRGTRFTQDTNFQDTTFGWFTSFDDAKFKGKVNFRGATFGWADFVGATFNGATNFGAKLAHRGSHFKGKASFEDATFMKEVNFGAQILGPEPNGTVFEDDAYFYGCTFKDHAFFQGATFKQYANFGSGLLSFGKGATFESTAVFEDAIFKIGNFQGVVFKDHADFRGAKFDKDARFGGNPLTENATLFMQRADFQMTHFAQEADFAGDKYSGGTIFMADTSFRNATFKKEPNFQYVHFNINLKSASRIVFPLDLKQNSNGLPEGAQWTIFDEEDSTASINRHRQGPSDERGRSGAASSGGRGEEN